MNKKINVYLKIAVLSGLLFSNNTFYAIPAYIPQELRECISLAYDAIDKTQRKIALEELYTAVQENRMFTSDVAVVKGIEEILEGMRILEGNNRAQQEVVKYLERYLNNINERDILLSIDGDASHTRSLPLGYIDYCMQGERKAYDFVRLSNQLSHNLLVCGNTDISSSPLIQTLRKPKLTPLNSPSVTFKPNDMTNSQFDTPPVIIGGTGVSDPIVNAWDLIASNNVQSPINLQFEVPGDLAKSKPVTLNLGILVPSNGLPNGRVNIQIESKYLKSSHSFNPDDISWTHENSSGNIMISEATTVGNVKYILVRIPLSSSHIKPGYFALLSLSRIAPTDSKAEYTGNISIISAAFSYTAQ